MIGDLFNTIFYQPLFNALIFLYNTIAFESFGIAVILLTLIIRLILYPLNKKAIESQKALNALQPKIKEIQTKFKSDRVKQSEELMKVYQENKINPASGCLPILIQLPILIALYQVFFRGLDPASLDALYSFVSRPEAIDPWFFGLVDLSKSNAIMAVLAGALTYVQSRMMMPKQAANSGASDFSAIMQKQMLYMMPVITVFITWKLPSGLALYWIVTTLFSIFQQYISLRTKKNEK